MESLFARQPIMINESHVDTYDLLVNLELERLNSESDCQLERLHINSTVAYFAVTFLWLKLVTRLHTGKLQQRFFIPLPFLPFFSATLMISSESPWTLVHHRRYDLYIFVFLSELHAAFIYLLACSILWSHAELFFPNVCFPAALLQYV